jgi:hypothetical protein
MVQEFKRYKLERFRILTGYLELLGGMGTIIGLQHKPLYLFSLAGLATLMLMGMIVRIRLKDSFRQMMPAFVLMSINAYLLIATFTSSHP